MSLFTPECGISRLHEPLTPGAVTCWLLGGGRRVPLPWERVPHPDCGSEQSLSFTAFPHL